MDICFFNIRNFMILLFTVYVDMGLATNNPITLTVVTSSGNSFSRSFSIKVTQIDCTSLNKGTEVLTVKKRIFEIFFIYLLPSLLLS